MAPPSFTTLPDEILLEIVEWTTEIVTAAINNAGTLIRDDLAFRRKRRAGAKIISTAEYMLLKHTVLSLSSVDQRFRLMLASRFFSSLKLNPVYKKDTMQRLGAALAFSPMLRACLKKLDFHPRSRMYDDHKFTDLDSLISGFRNLQSLETLSLHAPYRDTMLFRKLMSGSALVIFPNVRQLTICSTTSYVLRQCPKLKKLQLTLAPHSPKAKWAHEYVPSEDSKRMTEYHDSMQKQFQTLAMDRKANTVKDTRIEELVLSDGQDCCEFQELKRITAAFKEVKQFRISPSIEDCSVVDLAVALALMPDLEKLELPPMANAFHWDESSTWGWDHIGGVHVHSPAARRSLDTCASRLSEACKRLASITWVESGEPEAKVEIYRDNTGAVSRFEWLKLP